MPKLNSKLVLVQVDQPIEKDADGIFVQEEWLTLPPTGTVVDVADDVTFCGVGDRVFFERYTAIKSPPFDQDFRMCREDGILMVFDGKE